MLASREAGFPGRLGNWVTVPMTVPMWHGHSQVPHLRAVDKIGSCGVLQASSVNSIVFGPLDGPPSDAALHL
jgi:hypothetical protein